MRNYYDNPISEGPGGVLSAPEAEPVPTPEAGSVSTSEAGPVSAPEAGPVSPPEAGPVSAPEAGSVSTSEAGPVSAPEVEPVSAPEVEPVPTPGGEAQPAFLYQAGTSPQAGTLPPVGTLPQAGTSPQTGTLPQVGTALRTEKQRKPKAQSERGAAVILAALALVLGGTALLVAMGGASTGFTVWSPYGGGSGGGTPGLVLPGAGQGELERAPTGDGTVLPLDARPEGEAMPLQDIYRQVIPSIASIETVLPQGVSQGTGVVMSRDGYIITNAHVIEGGFRVEVSLEDGRSFPAKLVGSDTTTDLAVLKVEADDLVPAAFGSSEEMWVGDVVVAIGNPMGEELRGTMTDGILSAINRNVDVDGNSMTLLQTTAALNTGNSGGALVNEQGQVIGITNMKMVSTNAFANTLEGLGFAIPSTTVKTVVDALIQDGHVTGRPTLGVTVRGLYDEEKAQRGVECGLLVVSLSPGADAAERLQLDDILLTAQGAELNTSDDLLAVRDGLSAGESIVFQVDRAGERLEISVKLMEQYQLEQ